MPDAGQSYDPYKLIEDVAALLTKHGLKPERVDTGEPGVRVQGASMLLRGLDIEPLVPPEAALDLDGHQAYESRVHGD